MNFLEMEKAYWKNITKIKTEMDELEKKKKDLDRWKPKYGSVQSLSYVWLFLTPWTTKHQASLSIDNSKSLLKLISFELVMPSDHLILCRLLLLPWIFPSIRVFSNELVIT